MNFIAAHETIAPRKEHITIDYTNWRGERRVRRIHPVRIEFGSNEWHPEPQWLLHARDIEDVDLPMKTFALAGIHSFNPS